MRIKFAPLRWVFGVLYRAMFRRARNVYGIELPWPVKLGRRVIFEHQSGIVIHGDSVIGDDCIIRHGVTLGIKSLDRLHDAPILGKQVNIGAGAKILGRVTLGDGCNIGANAVVLSDVPAGATAVGIPARIIQKE